MTYKRTIQAVITFVLIFNSSISFAANGSDEVDFPALDGFELKTAYPVYIPDNLWEYINGGHIPISIISSLTFTLPST